VFERCTNYSEVLEQVRIDLHWNEPSDVVELEGRHNVGFGMHIRWKTMRINSEQRWVAYKETVAESQDKALELFATKKVDATLHFDFDLNRQTLSPISMNLEGELKKENDEYEDDEYEDDENGFELNDNNVGDLETYYVQENMDHSIPYSRCYASDSDDDGPVEEIDVEGFTPREAEIFKDVVGRDHRIPLFRDLSLADEAVVEWQGYSSWS